MLKLVGGGLGQKSPVSYQGTLLAIKAKAMNGLEHGRHSNRKAGVGAREMRIAVSWALSADPSGTGKPPPHPSFLSSGNKAGEVTL